MAVGGLPPSIFHLKILLMGMRRLVYILIVHKDEGAIVTVSP